MKSNTGDGLAIIINATYTVIDSWMSFVTWYSVSKFLPDAKIILAIERRAFDKCNLFQWMYNANNLIHRFHNDSIVLDVVGNLIQGNEGIIIKPTTVAVRDESTGILGPVDVHSDESTTFVDYQNGWGNFIVSRWVNKLEVPLSRAKKFSKEGMTVNETKVMKLWKGCSNLYLLM